LSQIPNHPALLLLALWHDAIARETKLAAVDNANSVDGEPESLLLEGYRVIESYCPIPRLCDLAKRSSTRSFEWMIARSAIAVQGGLIANDDGVAMIIDLYP